MRTVAEIDNVRHRLASIGEEVRSTRAPGQHGWGKWIQVGSVGYYEHQRDDRIGFTVCGLRMALIGSRCPDTPGHRIARPGCPLHEPPTDCPACG